MPEEQVLSFNQTTDKRNIRYTPPSFDVGDAGGTGTQGGTPAPRGHIQRGSTDKTPLLTSRPEPDTDDHDAPQGCRQTCIEIPLFLYFASVMMSLPVPTYYLTDMLYHELGVPNVTACSAQAQDQGQDLQDQITAKVTTYNLYMAFITNLTAILPVLFLGSFAQRFGRKLPLYLVSFGVLCKMVTYALVFHYRLRVEYLYLGCVFEGVTGGYGCFLMATYTIVADATREGGSRRSLKITFCEAATSIGASAGSLMAGYWVQYLGFVAPLIFTSGLQVLVLAFVLLALPTAPVSSPRSGTPSVCTTLLNCPKVFLKSAAGGRRARLMTSLVILFLGLINNTGFVSLILQFEISHPFCWTQTQVSVYSGVQILAGWICVLVITHLAQGSGWASDDALALVGSLSALAYALALAFATATPLIYLGGGLGLLSNMLWPMMRTTMSKAVEMHEQAPLFAGIGVVEMTASLVGSVGYPLIYRKSLAHMRGLSFLCMAGVNFVMDLLILRLIINRKSREKDTARDHYIQEENQQGKRCNAKEEVKDM